MRDHRRGLVAQRVAPVTQPRTQVGVLAVHEQALVEAADLFEGRPSHEERGADEPFDLLSGVVARPDDLARPGRARKHTVEEERLAECGPHARRPPEGELRLAAHADETRAHRRALGVAVERLGERLQRLRRHARIGIQKQDRGCVAERDTRIAPGGEAGVPPHVDRPDVEVPNGVHRLLRARVVDDDDLSADAAAERLDAGPQMRTTSISDDYDVDVHEPHLTRARRLLKLADLAYAQAVPAMRVAVVADVLLGQMGGVARSVHGVLCELAKLDPDRLEVTVVAHAKPDSIGDIPFRRSLAPRVPRFPGWVFALQRPFTLRDYDIVHYIDSRPPLDLAFGKPVKVVTQHGFSALTFGPAHAAPRKWIYLNKALLRVAPAADLTLTASESERRELLARTPIPPDRVVAVHHGVDHDRFRPLAPDAAREEVRRHFDLEGQYVLYISNHQRKKNTERLVEAFARVAAEVDDVQLVLTGWHTPRFRLVEELIERLGLRSKIGRAHV